MKNTININGQDFTLEQLTTLIEESKKPKEIHWTNKLVQPAKENYYFINNNDFQLKEKYEWSRTSSERKPELAFRTAEQAKLMADKCNLMIEMQNFAHAMNNGWIPDWSNDKQEKHGITKVRNTFNIINYATLNSFIFGIVLENKKNALAMFEEFKDRLHIYNQQY